MQVVADTFPAGTLSGAQNRAMQLIEEYEKQIVIFMEVP
jgi:anthranilate synthase component 1